jgi:uncharacterized protein (TIGR03435 family)
MIFGKPEVSRKLAKFAPLALAVMVIVALTALVWSQSAASQSPTTQDARSLEVMEAAGVKMTFDVASVKPNKSSDRPNSNVRIEPGDVSPPNGGLFSATNLLLIAYITFAYNLTVDQLLHLQPQIVPGFGSGSSTLPKWANTDRFDIEARAPGNPTRDQMRLMMQSLLADRFKLVVHTETKQGPVFGLVVSKAGRTGPQLQVHSTDPPCAPLPLPGSAPPPPAIVAGGFPAVCGAIVGMQASTPGPLRFGARNVTTGQLADFLFAIGVKSGSGVDRPVLDRTGLNGNFDFSIEFTFQMPPNANVPPDSAGPTFFEALQEQLGLKLEPTTGPISVFVVDHVEQPSPN